MSAIWARAPSNDPVQALVEHAIDMVGSLEELFASVFC
jgi:hypothetical protein